MIRFKQKGNWEVVDSFLEKIKAVFDESILDKYGKQGVEALREATPKDTGKTANSWRYVITRDGDSVRLSFLNDNVNEGYNVAILLQYGHGTGWGTYVEGIDYINPAITPIFAQMAEEVWKEVTKT